MYIIKVMYIKYTTESLTCENTAYLCLIRAYVCNTTLHGGSVTN